MGGYWWVLVGAYGLSAGEFCCWVGRFNIFIWIAVTVKRPCMVTWWVQVSGCLLTGEWDAGCVVLPQTLLTNNIFLLSDVRQQTNLAWPAKTMVQVNADNTTYHQQLFHC